MLMKVAGRVRGLFRPSYPENDEDQQIHISNGGEQIIVQGLPELTELVRMGESWQGTYATGVAAATALPTTTSGLSLVNNEPAIGKCFAIDSFGSWEAVVDATQTDVTAILAMLNARGSAAPSGGTVSTVIKSLSGRGAYGGSAVLRSAATVINDTWFAHNTAGQMAPAAAGANWKVNEVNCRGLYLVPPGGGFSIAAIKAAAAAALQQFYFIRWHEVQLNYRP